MGSSFFARREIYIRYYDQKVTIYVKEKDVMTIMDARKMTKTQIESSLGDHVTKLEELGMDHVSACEFVSTIMNLGIALQERYLKKN